jgi:hypothetical protein
MNKSFTLAFLLAGAMCFPRSVHATKPIKTLPKAPITTSPVTVVQSVMDGLSKPGNVVSIAFASYRNINVFTALLGKEDNYQAINCYGKGAEVCDRFYRHWKATATNPIIDQSAAMTVGRQLMAIESRNIINHPNADIVNITNTDGQIIGTVYNLSNIKSKLDGISTTPFANQMIGVYQGEFINKMVKNALGTSKSQLYPLIK